MTTQDLMNTQTQEHMAQTETLHWKVSVPQMEGRLGRATLERDSLCTQATRHQQGQWNISFQEERTLGP